MEDDYEAYLLTRRIRHLFSTHKGKDGKPITTEEVSQRIGGIISKSYISRLRTGRELNPSIRVVRALAKAFDVPVSYLVDMDSPIIDPMLFTRSRTSELNEQTVRAIIDALNGALEAEKETKE